MDTTFALLVNNPAAYAVFKDVLKDMPHECESYIIGGAIRNAIYKHYFVETLIQRDYDQILTKNSHNFLAYLDSLGFTNGKIVTEHQVVKAKALVPDAAEYGYDDSVVFDMHLVDDTSALENLENNVPLTMNGFALSMRDLFNPNWLSQVISLPSAFDDIRNKQIRLNPKGYRSEPATIFAVLRFVSAGFVAPTKDELNLLLRELPKLNSDRFARNIPKVYAYIGGEAASKQLVKKLGITGNLFDETDVKSGKVQLG